MLAVLAVQLEAAEAAGWQGAADAVEQVAAFGACPEEERVDYYDGCCGFWGATARV